MSSGIYKSRKLECPLKGVRPTTDKVKEAIFSVLAPDIQDAYVLDLFAGSGNLGIEALSRGAEHVTFIDQSMLCKRTIEKNLSTLNISGNATIIRSDALSFARQCTAVFDLIFMDPPYNKGLASKTVPHVYNLLKIGGILTIEHSPDEVIDMQHWKTRIYGDTMITYIKRCES
ncbi:MAG: 16S rRNA (guanine(966)-N(2))-methyltransferase RsmD [Deltaproteobacteria bacterium]|nr:16S rRNA (guanine(966)-N(2))-methyltransferase RsmD [Deltaproteobacteria bacterium]